MRMLPNYVGFFEHLNWELVVLSDPDHLGRSTATASEKKV